MTQIAGKTAINDAKGNLTEYEINGKEYEVDYNLDNCPRSAHALRNPISSSGNAGRTLSIQTDAVIINLDVDNNDVEKYRRLVGILDLESEANLARRVSSREADANQYRYDALGRRVIRQEGTTKTALIWWGNSEKHRRLVGVLDRMSGASEARRVKAREASLNQCAEHKHQAGQTVIQNDIMAHPSRLNSVIARAVDGSKFKLEWYHKNYLDHVYAVSDDSGDILEHYRYTAFGEVQIYNASGNQVATTQIDNHILWNTRRRDELTGYYLYKYRHYSSELGRWLARDPIEENGGMNLYGFVGNQPVGRWDRLGLAVLPSWVHYGVVAKTVKLKSGTTLAFRITSRKQYDWHTEYSGKCYCRWRSGVKTDTGKVDEYDEITYLEGIGHDVALNKLLSFLLDQAIGEAAGKNPYAKAALTLAGAAKAYHSGLTREQISQLPDNAFIINKESLTDGSTFILTTAGTVKFTTWKEIAASKEECGKLNDNAKTEVEYR